MVASFGVPVGWKRHPDDRVEMGAAISGVTTYRKERFEEVMGDFDVLVFDYFSSAFSIGAATNKPIVYLDLGLRNFTPAGLDAIKKRCVYVQASPLDVEASVQQALASSRKVCVNDYSPTFSLADSRPREAVVAEVVCSELGLPHPREQVRPRAR